MSALEGSIAVCLRVRLSAVHLSVRLPVCLSVCPSARPPIRPIDPPTCPSACPPMCPSACPPVCPSACPPVCPSTWLMSVCRTCQSPHLRVVLRAANAAVAATISDAHRELKQHCYANEAAAVRRRWRRRRGGGGGSGDERVGGWVAGGGVGGGWGGGWRLTGCLLDSRWRLVSACNRIATGS